MEILKNRICKDGKVIEDRILKVDSFLNHQLDVELFNEIGKEFKNRFKNKKISKILTVETSGIGIACIVAQHLGNVPVVFAKKHSGINMDTNNYEAKVYSFTKEKEYIIKVSKKFINKNDNILIIDDFLASGSAMIGLMSICEQSGANIQGVGVVIEKGFQGGRELIENKGIQLESLAIVEDMRDGQVIFRE
ncbi:xanthine phosphoribosyltransferase [Clostridium tetanomorphum]|uniref:Xanthine phosphoribosyltransferase n=1 Tax=Clostridium tetanomorphum TaxID=1553 RepID=A0A923EB40_CLOTT|nr:xanthine phosphoribosyltransferase [Clostridium tetanomorphum]KAJ48963.1 xanthine phosphoribosyltransferase [Clostridium tetanomorphum DSM 665]KAJ51322.1 xanthine phosphoribosyltransferase [Clostridium tetanomorphum DSM 665]MBC2399823.1 xanthine phosphoribosyltransferase [Clostridium tetanomorphum]MBP1865987.1 xanthine phosphoribosyltransferase [Clostridium tetanomorphum]NRS85959.1 xanthine phosphoribosyltransferase [Clostridium tetanomorphum]